MAESEKKAAAAVATKSKQEKKGNKNVYFWKLNLNPFTSIWYDEKSSRAKKKTKKNPDEETPEDEENNSEPHELRQLAVLAYILQNVHQNDNTIPLTFDEIAESTGVSKDTVARIMDKMGKANFIRRVHNGVYMINPYFLVWGDENKRGKLRSKFNRAHPLKKKPRSKKKDAEQEQGMSEQGEAASDTSGQDVAGQEAPEADTYAQDEIEQDTIEQEAFVQDAYERDSSMLDDTPY